MRLTQHVGIQQYSHTINHCSILLQMHNINYIQLDDYGAIAWKYVLFEHSLCGQV